MTKDPPIGRHLALATVSFGLCFMAWGLVSAFAGWFRGRFALTATQTALLVAVPVLLGALARLPLGLLADRLGGRRVFAALMIVVAIPVAIVPHASSFGSLLAVAFFLGLAGSSFAVGVTYVSRWATPAGQGGALGVYGLGNAGHSAAVFLGPVLAAAIGPPAVFRVSAVLLVVWGVVFAVLARDAPARTPPGSFAAAMRVLARERLAWALAAFYFLTFGGFVAFSIYLPVLLRDTFGLTTADAGFRTAGFVILATAMRPVGGWLADRIGGARVLRGVFHGVAPFALLLAWPSIVPFTVGALGCAALLGLGNGAVFKLVPQYFPAATGTVTGLVGAMGGLGSLGIVAAYFLYPVAKTRINNFLFAEKRVASFWRTHASQFEQKDGLTKTSALCNREECIFAAFDVWSKHGRSGTSGMPRMFGWCGKRHKVRV